MGLFDDVQSIFGLSSQVNPQLNSSLQFGGQNTKAYTYQPTSSVSNQKTTTFSPTTTKTISYAPVYSNQSNYAPQSTYAPSLFISSPFASSNVNPSYGGGQSAGLSPSPIASSMTNPSTSVSPPQYTGLSPSSSASPQLFDFSALLPFIIVGALAVFLLKTGGGKK